MQSDRAAFLAELADGLNEQQGRALLSDNPRLIMVAGAGSGKTTVLARKVAHSIVSGTPADLVMAVTFTRAAAAEMRERITMMLQNWPRWNGRLPTIRTLHSWGVTLLRQRAEVIGRTRHFSIYDERDQADIYRALAADDGDDKAATRRMSTLLGRQRLRKLYLERLRLGNALDYDLIETLTLQLIRTDPVVQKEWVGRYRRIFVDEYQDTNLAQVAITDELLPPALFIVGDPRQSIYRFRGAEPQTIIERSASADFGVVELPANYRSTEEIVDLANHCVRGPWAPMRAVRGPGRPVEGYKTRLEPATVAAMLEREHANGVAWKDMAVLGRSWGDHEERWRRRGLAAIRDHLQGIGIPCRYCGDSGDPWASDQGRQVARLLMLANNPADENLAALVADFGALGRTRFDDIRLLRAKATRERVSLLSVMARGDKEWWALSAAWSQLAGLNAPASDFIRELRHLTGDIQRAVLTGRLDELAEFAQLADDLDLSLPGFVDWWIGRSTMERVNANADEVTITTVHGSKGLEWPVVILTDCRDGVFPTNRSKATDDDKEEDRRVLYVGITRARDLLVLTRALEYRNPWGGPPMPCGDSPFLADVTTARMVEWLPPAWGPDWPWK